MKLTRIAVIVFIALSLLLSIIIPSKEAHADGTEYYAIIVSISNYLYQDDLDYADDGAGLYQKLAPVIGSDHIKLLTNWNAGKTDIQNSIQNWLAPREDSDDIVLFYFFGHGGEYLGDYYLSPYDDNPYLLSSSISDSELNSWLSSLDSNNIVVILDTCHAGGLIPSLSSAAQVIMASSTASESSSTSSALQSGVFTYYLVQALENATIADNNTDYTLTTQEIFNYTSPRVTQYVTQQWGDSQHPVNYDSYSGGLQLFSIATIESNIASGSIAIDGTSCPSQSSCFVLIKPNSSRSITISSIVQPQTTDDTLSRYIFVSWDDGNTQSTRTFYTGGEYTATYKTQYCLISFGPYSETKVEWFDSGTSASTDTAQETITNGDTRYVFRHWDIDGVAVSENPANVYMNTSHSAFANYRTQYYLSVSSEHGSVSGSDWYDYGTTATTGTAQQIITEGGTRYVFEHWNVDNTVRTGNPVTVSMYAPHTATAEYKTQYYLDVDSKYGNPSGEGWYDSNTVAQISVTPVVGTLIRHKFDGWSGSSYDKNATTNVYMYQPQSIVATWKTDYLYLGLLIGGLFVICILITVLLASRLKSIRTRKRSIKNKKRYA